MYFSRDLKLYILIYLYSVPVGSAAVVTNIHALTTASVIHKFSHNLPEIVLLTGGFGPCSRSTRTCKTAHHILGAQPHPAYNNTPPFADIAVVFVSK